MKRILLLIAMLPATVWAQSGPAATAPASAPAGERIIAPTTAPTTQADMTGDVLIKPAAVSAGDKAPSPETPVVPVKDNMRSLWLENVQAPEAAEAAELSKAVRELMSIEVGNRPKPQPKSATTTSTPASQPVESAPTRKSLSPELAAKLEALAAGEGDIAAIADELYQAQEFDGAAVLYELALKKEKESDAGWLLLQLANCRVKKDPAVAMALYKRVTTEHASSPWASIAATQAGWVQWNQAVLAMQDSKSTSQPSAQISQGKTR